MPDYAIQPTINDILSEKDVEMELAMKLIADHR
jgi:hypothetical protein